MPVVATETCTRESVESRAWSDGVAHFKVPRGDPCESQPGAARPGDTAYFGTTRGDLLALDRMTGEERWSFKTRGMIWATPIVADGVVYIGSDDGTLYALSGRTQASSAPASARMAVYWSENGSGEPYTRVRDYFEAEGYEVLDADALERFMWETTAEATLSTGVLAACQVPASLVEATDGPGLLRQFLDAGGKVVWLGRPPLAAEGVEASVESGSLAEDALDVSFTPDLRGFVGASVTPEGARWGLRGWWVGCCSVADTEDVTEVLAVDGYGNAAAWVKNYGPPAVPGMCA